MSIVSCSLLQATIEEMKEFYGPENPTTIHTVAILADLLRRQNNLSDAEAFKSSRGCCATAATSDPLRSGGCCSVHANNLEADDSSALRAVGAAQRAKSAGQRLLVQILFTAVTASFNHASSILSAAKHRHQHLKHQ